MDKQNVLLSDVVIKFAGDSGDGMQLTGSQFTNNSALWVLTWQHQTSQKYVPLIGTLPGVRVSSCVFE